MRITRDDAITALRSELAPFNARLASESGRTPVEPVAHPQLADVVVIPSAPAVQSPRVAYEPEWRSIIVDRLCGEAVLRGSDIFARGHHEARAVD
ncbi:hypothetical protein PINS_up016715 [Pythium insidiosum]|nr:hypothetical protein PINS_up016715 [Pythium insidiosum]